MDNRVAGCQLPAGVTPLLRFGLPSPPGVVGMVMAPGSASGKHPFYVVCRCGLGCCVSGGRCVGVGAWGRGPLVMLHVCALFVGGGGCVWVKFPCRRCGPTPGVGCWAGGGARGGWCGCPPLLLRSTISLCSAVLCAACCHVLARVPAPRRPLRPCCGVRGDSRNGNRLLSMPSAHSTRTRTRTRRPSRTAWWIMKGRGRGR